MRSIEPAVKPKGFTAVFSPQHKKVHRSEQRKLSTGIDHSTPSPRLNFQKFKLKFSLPVHCYHELRRQHPRTDQKIGWGADIAGSLDSKCPNIVFVAAVFFSPFFGCGRDDDSLTIFHFHFPLVCAPGAWYDPRTHRIFDHYKKPMTWAPYHVISCVKPQLIIV